MNVQFGSGETQGGYDHRVAWSPCSLAKGHFLTPLGPPGCPHREPPSHTFKSLMACGMCLTVGWRRAPWRCVLSSMRQALEQYESSEAVRRPSRVPEFPRPASHEAPEAGPTRLSSLKRVSPNPQLRLWHRGQTENGRRKIDRPHAPIRSCAVDLEDVAPRCPSTHDYSSARRFLCVGLQVAEIERACASRTGFGLADWLWNHPLCLHE